MSDWILLSLVAMVLWGTVGLLQKLGTNRLDASSLLVWVTAGFVLIAPAFLAFGNPFAVTQRNIWFGIASGALNGLGSWFLFVSLERGAKASVAVPLTALYPLVTVAFAVAFLKETLSVRQTFGVALAVIGGVMLSFEPAP